MVLLVSVSSCLYAAGIQKKEPLFYPSAKMNVKYIAGPKAQKLRALLPRKQQDIDVGMEMNYLGVLFEEQVSIIDELIKSENCNV